MVARGSASPLLKEWRFRHDKVMDFFIVQAFLGEDNTRPAEHLGDARFRGVYFLLAQLMPLDVAEQLRETLIQYTIAGTSSEAPLEAGAKMKPG